MTWSVVRLCDAKPQPWRNGGGLTRELLALPSNANWSLRISVAEVESNGPFSAFPGVERWFAVLKGTGVRLGTGDTQRSVAARSEPIRFDGGAPIDCQIDGATQDFNLMVRGRQARLQRVLGQQDFRCRPGVFIAIYAEAPASVAIADQRLDVEPGTLVWRIFEASVEVGVRGDDALWMEVDA